MNVLTPHLFVDISSHGYGHLAQTAPVLNALRVKLPALHLTIRCGLPRTQLAPRIEGEFAHLSSASDFGLTMKSALDPDWPASMARYRAFHADWDAQVADYAALLAQHRPDWVLANISYLALAAAERARIPATAMCSLNWADIFYPYCANAPDAPAIHEQMLTAYRSAETFLRVTPGMDMPALHNLIPIGPIARQGRPMRDALHSALGLPNEVRLALVTMGGIPLHLTTITWPQHANLLWIAARDTGLQRADVIALERINMDFNDLVASCDCVMTKSGYGTFVEASAAGTPLLYVTRPDWAEERFLAEWLHRHNRAVGISRAQFEHGDFADAIWNLARGERAAPINPAGIEQAAELLLVRLAATQRHI